MTINKINKMKETLIICNHCGGNACSEISNEQITIWNCFGCGFTSNSTLTEEKVIEIEKTLPELYKDLKFIDTSGYIWYPLSVMMDDKAMIFAEGIPSDLHVVATKFFKVSASKSPAMRITKAAIRLGTNFMISCIKSASIGISSTPTAVITKINIIR